MDPTNLPLENLKAIGAALDAPIIIPGGNFDKLCGCAMLFLSILVKQEIADRTKDT